MRVADRLSHGRSPDGRSGRRPSGRTGRPTGAGRARRRASRRRPRGWRRSRPRRPTCCAGARATATAGNSSGSGARPRIRRALEQDDGRQRRRGPQPTAEQAGDLGRRDRPFAAATELVAGPRLERSQLGDQGRSWPAGRGSPGDRVDEAGGGIEQRQLVRHQLEAAPDQPEDQRRLALAAAAGDTIAPPKARRRRRHGRARPSAMEAGDDRPDQRLEEGDRAPVGSARRRASPSGRLEQAGPTGAEVGQGEVGARRPASVVDPEGAVGGLDDGERTRGGRERTRRPTPWTSRSSSARSKERSAA